MFLIKIIMQIFLYLLLFIVFMQGIKAYRVEKEINSIINDIKNGTTLQQIAKKYSVTYTTIKNHLNAKNIDLNNYIRKRWTKGTIDKNKKSTKIIKNQDYYYILGVYFGDGYSSKIINTTFPNTNTWKFGLKTIDKNFIENFHRSIKKSIYNSNPFIKKANRTKKIKPTWKDIWYCEIYNQDVGIHFKNISLNNIQIPSKYSNYFLRGLYDSEGSVQLNRQKKACGIRLGNTNKKLLQLAKNLLVNNFNIQSKITRSKTPQGKPYYELRFYKKEYRKTFKLNIGFNIKRKQKLL
jgi:intein-encoded DNA endonuclease-like protein